MIIDVPGPAVNSPVEVERGPDELAGSDVTAAEAGRKTGWHAHLVAGARGCLDAERATSLLGDGDLRHAVTLASRQVPGQSARVGTATASLYPRY